MWNFTARAGRSLDSRRDPDTSGQAVRTTLDVRATAGGTPGYNVF
jgi:hypothetical protein